MADIQYLNYGDLQIELLALLNNLADNVQSYVQSQPWSKKRKEKFMSAYQDIMNRGLLGASNSTGLWVIDAGGEPIDFDSKDKKDREMYYEAAYFIQLQMSKLPTKASLEETLTIDKSKLPVFNNEEFTNSFYSHVNNELSGGRPLKIGGDDDEWNLLDERDLKTGLRGTKNRANKLADLLESYSNKFDSSKYNFEGSPFQTEDEFKSRLQKAVAALRTEDPSDDRATLLALGLTSSDWFNNGSGDPLILDDGTRTTYGDYYRSLSKKPDTVDLSRVREYLNTLLNNPLDIDALQKAFLEQTDWTDADKAEILGIALDVASIVDPEPWSAAGLGLAAAGARNYAGLQQPKPWDFMDYVWQGVDYATGAVGAIPLLGDSILAAKAVKAVTKLGKKVLAIPALADAAMNTPGVMEAIRKANNDETLTVLDFKSIGLFARGLLGLGRVTKTNRAERRVLEKSGYDLSNLNGFLKKTGLTSTDAPTQHVLKVNIKGETKEIPITPERRAELDKALRKKGNNLAEKDKIIRESKEVNDYIRKNGLKPEDVSAVESSSFRNTLVKGFGVLPRRLRTTKANFDEHLAKPTKPDTFNEYVGPAPETARDYFRFTGNRSFSDRLKYGSNHYLRKIYEARYKPLQVKVSKWGTEETPKQKLLPASTENKQLLLPEPGAINLREHINIGQLKGLRNNQQAVNALIDDYGISGLSNVYFGARGYGRPITNQHTGTYDINKPLTDGTYNLNVDGTNITFTKQNGKTTVSFNGTKKEFKNLKELENLVKARLYLAKLVLNETKDNISKTAEILRGLKAKGVFKQGGRIDKLKIQKYKEFINK